MSESLNQQIDRLEGLYKSEKDPQGRAFVPLAEAHRRFGDLGKALTVIQEGLGAHPDFASAHMVAGWVHRSRREPDDAMRSFKRVLELDAENSLAQAAIAELIDDERAQTYRDKMVVKKVTEPPTVATTDDERPVVPISSLAPAVPDATGAGPVGSKIYTQTLAELYASQGAVDNAIEVYRKLIAADPDDQALVRRLAELESLEPGSLGVGDVRQTVPIESLAPDG